MGKSKGKKLLSIAGFAFGFANPGAFGLGVKATLMGGLYGASLGSTIWNVMHPPKIQENYGKFDSIMNTVDSEASISVIYGIRRWGGNQVWHKVEDDNKRVIKDIIICEGEIEGIYDVRANDVKIGKPETYNDLYNATKLPRKYLERIIEEQGKNHVTDCSFEFRNGSSSQAPPSNWDVVGGYKNCSWLRATLNLSEKMQGGNPTISMLVKGKKIQVFRNGRWNYEWSDNPVWCLRDFLLSKRYGLGRYITADMLDDYAFRESADYCDQLVQYKDADGVIQTEKRFTLNMIIDQQRDAVSVLGDMMANFGGFLTFTNDKIALKIEKATNTSYSFNDDTIIKDTMEITQIPLQDNPNMYRVGFFSPENNWTQVKVLVEDPADQKERGVVISKDVTLGGVISQSQALRLSRFYKDLNRVCSIVIQFATATHAMHLEPGDVVSVSWNNVFENMPFRILEISDNGHGLYHMKARQYNSSIYNDALGAEIQVRDYTTIPSPVTDDVPEVKNISLEEIFYVQKTGSTISYIDGFCEVPAYQFFRHLNLEYSDDGQQKWHSIGTTRDGRFTVPNVRIGRTYYVRVQVENSIGRQGDWVVSNPITLTGKNEPPNNVKNFQAKFVSGGFLLTWDSNADPDIDGYNLYMGENGASMFASKLIAEKLASTSLFIPIETAGKYVFHIVAVDTCGNISEIPATVLTEFLVPPNVEGFDVVVNGADLDFRWYPIAQSGIRYEIRRGEQWGYGQVIGRTADSFYRTLFPADGSHVFWIKAVDAYGNYSEKPSRANTVVQPQNDRNVVAVINQVAKGWSGIKINMHVVDGGLKLASGAIRGEHIVEIELPKEYSARNWVSSNMTGILDDEITWGSASFKWSDAESNSPWTTMADITGASLQYQISRYQGLPQSTIENFTLDETTKGDKNTSPAESIKITYGDSRFKKGVNVLDTTKLSWNINLPSTFNTTFRVKLPSALNENVVYMTLRGASGRLMVGYDAERNVFYLQDHLGRRVEVGLDFKAGDHLTFGICQTTSKRKLFVHSFCTNAVVTSEQAYTPVGSLTAVFLYPKLN